MKMKKILSIAIALATIFSVMSFSAISTNAVTTKTPTTLYLGDNGEGKYYGWNLISYLRNKNTVLEDRFDNTGSLYRLYFNDDNECVLELHNYVVTRTHINDEDNENYGIFCDGDLNVVFYGDCSINCIISNSLNGVGIKTKGSLKLFSGAAGSTLNVSGRKAGIIAEENTVVFNGGAVNVVGENWYAVSAENVLVKGGAVEAKSKTLCVTCDNFAINGGSIRTVAASILTTNIFGIKAAKYLINAGGTIDRCDLTCTGGDVFVYLKPYTSIYYKYNTNIIDYDRPQPTIDDPDIGFASANAKVAKAKDNFGNIVATGRGTTYVSLVLRTQAEDFIITSCEVNVYYTWWQWILKIFTLGLY